MAEETLREMLARRRREIVERLEPAMRLVEELKKELDEIGRAYAAIEGPDDQSRRDRLFEAAMLAAANPFLDNPLFSTDRHQFPELSIRDLILAALTGNRNYVTHGASANELMKFIGDVFGRNIERTSLSPTLSRLRDDGMITSTDDGKWRIEKIDERALATKTSIRSLYKK
jgi:hypothetical protein